VVYLAWCARGSFCCGVATCQRSADVRWYHDGAPAAISQQSRLPGSSLLDLSGKDCGLLLPQEKSKLMGLFLLKNLGMLGG